MHSIIEDFYYGKLSSDALIKTIDPAYRPLNRKITAFMDTFKKNLSESEFKELEEMLDLMGQAHSMELASAFTHGFRLGARVMSEVFVRDV